MDLSALPGGDLVERGLADLAEGRETDESLLVSIGAPRLMRGGIVITGRLFSEPEHRLYDRLAAVNSDTAHGRYNALVRRLVSFESALERIRPFGDGSER